MSSGSLPKRDRIDSSGSFIRSSSLKRLCRPRLDRRQSESSRRFWAERDSESTALTCRRHSITFASRSIDRRATMRLRQHAPRKARPFSHDYRTDMTRRLTIAGSALPGRRGLVGSPTPLAVRRANETLPNTTGSGRSATRSASRSPYCAKSMDGASRSRRRSASRASKAVRRATSSCGESARPCAGHRVGLGRYLLKERQIWCQSALSESLPRFCRFRWESR